MRCKNLTWGGPIIQTRERAYERHCDPEKFTLSAPDDFEYLELIVVKRLPTTGVQLVADLRRCSGEFRTATDLGDNAKQLIASSKAIEVLTLMFDHWRNEQDYGNISAAKMQIVAGSIVNNVDESTRDILVAAAKLSRRRLPRIDLNLRTALNKLAHQQRGASNYRLTKRHHYFIISGLMQNSSTKYWVAEIEIGRLANVAEVAL